MPRKCGIHSDHKNVLNAHHGGAGTAPNSSGVKFQLGSHPFPFNYPLKRHHWAFDVQEPLYFPPPPIMS